MTFLENKLFKMKSCIHKTDEANKKAEVVLNDFYLWENLKQKNV